MRWRGKRGDDNPLIILKYIHNTDAASFTTRSGCFGCCFLAIYSSSIRITIVSSLFRRELHLYMCVCVYVYKLIIKVKLSLEPSSPARALNVTNFCLSPIESRKYYIVYTAFTLKKIESTRVATRLRRVALNTCQQSVQALPMTMSFYPMYTRRSPRTTHAYIRTQTRGWIEK